MASISIGDHVTACTVDAARERIADVRQLVTTLEAVPGWLGAYCGARDDRHGGHAVLGMVAHVTGEQGRTVRVTPALHVKLVWQTHANGEPIAARYSAELLRRRTS